MSNFLNARRGLSPEAGDRLLDVLRVDIRDLADPGGVATAGVVAPVARSVVRQCATGVAGVMRYCGRAYRRRQCSTR